MLRFRWYNKKYHVTSADVQRLKDRNTGELLQDCKRRLEAETKPVLQYTDNDTWYTVESVTDIFPLPPTNV